MTPGQIFIISGPPGAGKSSVVSQVRRLLPDLAYSISYTTRVPRPQEQNGKDYYFISQEEFQLRLQAGEIIEHVRVFDNYYGTSSLYLQNTITAGNDILLDIEVIGAASLKKKFPQAVFIFLLPPTFTELKKRLQDRNTETQEKINERLQRLAFELEQMLEHYTHLVVNSEIEQAASDVKSIITSERLKIARLWPGIEHLWIV